MNFNAFPEGQVKTGRVGFDPFCLWSTFLYPFGINSPTRLHLGKWVILVISTCSFLRYLHASTYYEIR